MRQINILTYSVGLALSIKYFELIIQSLEPNKFNPKVKVLFDILLLI